MFNLKHQLLDLHSPAWRGISSVLWILSLMSRETACSLRLTSQSKVRKGMSKFALTGICFSLCHSFDFLFSPLTFYNLPCCASPSISLIATPPPTATHVYVKYAKYQCFVLFLPMTMVTWRWVCHCYDKLKLYPSVKDSRLTAQLSSFIIVSFVSIPNWKKNQELMGASLLSDPSSLCF